MTEPAPEGKKSRWAAAHAAKAKVATAREKEIKAEIDALLADPHINDELKRKLRYCQEELKRREGDLFLKERRRELLREARRRFFT